MVAPLGVAALPILIVWVILDVPGVRSNEGTNCTPFPWTIVREPPVYSIDEFADGTSKTPFVVRMPAALIPKTAVLLPVCL